MMPNYSFTYNETDFSTKFAALRSFYGLTSNNMAELLNLKSRSSIFYLEQHPMKRAKPTFQIICSLWQIFGISIDWLIGSDRSPYTEETVKRAENAQASRFINAQKAISPEADVPENAISFLKHELFPNSVIQNKLQLCDRFVLLFILNFLAICIQHKYQERTRKVRTKKKFRSLKETFGLVDSSDPPEEIKWHPGYTSAFLTLKEAVKSPLGIPYSLYPTLVLPGQDKMERIDHSVLDDRWNFEQYLTENFIEAIFPK